MLAPRHLSALALVVACGGAPPPQSLGFPEILRFEVDRAAIVAGESVTLRWRIENADAVEIPGLYGPARVLENELRTHPLASTRVFRFVATNRAGETARTAVVTVEPRPGGALPEIVRFEVAPESTPAGSWVTIGYEVVGATALELGDGDAVLERLEEPSGELDFLAKRTTTLVLTARNDAGAVEAGVRLTVF